jgi:hypothetical protein
MTEITILPFEASSRHPEETCMINARFYGVKRQSLAWSTSFCLVMALCGCDRSMIVRVVMQGTDGTNEFWVCDSAIAQQCDGEREGDIDPKGYQKRLQVVAPPAECTHGTVAAMDIVIDRGNVTRVRYECGLLDTPTDLPPGSALPPGAPESPSTN